ncbi:hypothetical protein PsorP6_016313 [Peronosclerospora sorghi]|uniref:Uncharacterized protein n=1 Tax=Peronosclerospora sorghi TaxID=230839 RepID=A0ACC0VRY8_9STRA|nr:hypothetical protein PsorP6_016313 [Peronosclerospora sorghi]
MNCFILIQLYILYEQNGEIGSLEEIYLLSFTIKECEIVNYYLESSLKDKVIKIMPVQKQTTAGKRTRFKAFVTVED